MTNNDCEKRGNVPIVLQPAAKDYLWGGSRLKDDFGMNIDINPFAEAWVCSTHPDGESTVYSSAIFEPLSSVLGSHPEYLGSHVLSITKGRAELPILIKLIDARKDLSVQVHPDDEYATVHENGSLGKTELWYVLDTKLNSTLVYGFNRDVTADQIRASVKNGSILRYLNFVPVKRNDLFLVEPGTVHAIGAGVLVAEIQESSNITYRLYDYDRIDKNGNKRLLNLERALEVLNMKSSLVPRQPMRVLKYRNGMATELLGRCKYFQVERILLNTETQRRSVDYRTGSNSFHVLLVVDGCGNISDGGKGGQNNRNNYAGIEVDRFNLDFFKGDCIFVPAESITLKLQGKAQILDVSC